MLPIQEREDRSGLPAVDGHGVVPCLALQLANLLDDFSDSLEVAAVAVRSPVDDVELCDLVGLPRLGRGEGGRGGRGGEGAEEEEGREGGGVAYELRT